VRKFGTSIEDACRATPSDIDRNLDYAVIDDRGLLRFATGGIPLKVQPIGSSQGDVSEFARSRAAYALRVAPFVDKSGAAVGVITVFDRIEPLPWRSVQFVIENVLL